MPSGRHLASLVGASSVWDRQQGSTKGSDETLGSFLTHHGSRLKVAEELGLHSNTVRDRLAQIEHAIGRSLDEPDTRAAAWIAVRARELSVRERAGYQRTPQE